MTKKEQIRVHQAFYGEVNRSHGCLFSTIEDAELKTFLTGFTDRPSALPPGIIMQPYYSAIAHGKYYIFTLTFPDNTAQRTGMVFTQVLIVYIDDIQYVTNLYNLFDHFCKKIPEDKLSLPELTISISSLEISKTPNTFPEYVLLSVQELIQGKLPILFCGESESFIRTIASIWVGLPQSFRSKMSFTAGFSSANIDASKTFIHFQNDIEYLLRNNEFVSSTNSNIVEVTSTVEKYILTSLPDNQFELFIKQLNINLDNWSILQLCAKAYGAYQNYSQLNNDALKQLIRQLAKISPQGSAGKSVKNNVISEIKRRIDSAKENNFKSLKNLPLDAFESGVDIVSNSVKSFVETELIKDNDFNDEQISEVIILSYRESKPNWWHNIIKEALENNVKNEQAVSIHNLWKLLVKSEDSLSVVLTIIPEKEQYERLLIKYIPQSIPPSIAKVFAKSIQKRKWILLHAHLIQSYLTAEEAAKQQLSFEKNSSSSSFEGTKHIIKDVTNEELLSLAMETKETFFISEYASRSIKQPALLNGLDINDQTWLSIWATALKETNDLEKGIPSPAEKIDRLLSGMAEGNKVPDEIIDQIAKGKYANISALRNRSDLWKYLQMSNKELFLEATANALIKDIHSKGLAGLTFEPELTNYISSDSYMTALLKTYKSDINVVLEVYEYIDNLKDSFLADYIKFYPNNLSAVQSARLGTLVLAKRLHLSARQIFEKAKKVNSFKIALTNCQSIANLGFWDKFLWGELIGETVSTDSVYFELLSIAIELYERGPEDNNIWKRAGGDISKLHNHKSREDNWRNAIDLIKNGGGGKKISVKSLIEEMVEDHPNNTELKQIAKYFK